MGIRGRVGAIVLFSRRAADPDPLLALISTEFAATVLKPSDIVYSMRIVLTSFALCTRSNGGGCRLLG